MTERFDGRRPDQLRQVRFTRNWLDHAEGSVLVEFGKTRVLVAASVTEGVPRWLKGQGKGWVTAEYEMLPRSTHTRSDRESRKGKVGGRTHEISRLIGRALRAVIDYEALGENTIVIDCDVLQADGGTRTASITGAYVALADAVSYLRGRGALKGEPLKGSVAAISVGVVLLIVGVMTDVPAVGIVGFAIMFGGVAYALLRPAAKKGPLGTVDADGKISKTAKATKRRGSGDFMTRLEERWDRRRDQGL